MQKLVRSPKFVILALALMLGCAGTSGPSTPTAAEHRGYRFPDVVGRLRLQNFHEYDDAALGAVANYRLAPQDPLIVSVYIFPTPRFADGSIQPIEIHAQSELRGLLQFYEGAQVIDWPAELSYKNLAEREIYQAALEIQHPEIGTAYSLIALSSEGQSRIKFRISYAAQDADAGFAIRSFLEQFP